MGYLSGFGKLIILLSVVGFIVGISEAIHYESAAVAGVSAISLLGGVYVGYLGIRLEELDNANEMDSTVTELSTLSA